MMATVDAVDIEACRKSSFVGLLGNSGAHDDTLLSDPVKLKKEEQPEAIKEREEAHDAHDDDNEAALLLQLEFKAPITFSHEDPAVSVLVYEARPRNLDICGCDAWGFNAWPVSQAFSRYLCSSRDVVQKLIENCNVVELGSGTGLLGLTALNLGAKKVVFTDVPEVLPLTKENIKRNNISVDEEAKIALVSGTWGDDEAVAKVHEMMSGRVDTILASQVLHSHTPEVLECLTATLTALAKKGGNDEPVRLLVASQDYDGFEGSKEELEAALSSAGWTNEFSTSLLEWDSIMDDASCYGRQVQCFRAPLNA